ncbi:porin family protein [Vibrio hannami]|uniref:porin family protein n=1 Tax=Vibrio hannami TaxID=2717094 RepID=UPI00240ED4FA|nr:porin family protein [Vibrio hannami]MDG3087210.1 porin family protein [Vibrio hannami]
MKKLAVAVLSTLSFSTIAMDDFSGHRAGIGYSSLDFSDLDATYDAGNGFKLEYGYDFNRILGLNVSYEKNSDKVSEYGFSSEIDGGSFKIDTDIGYAFQLDQFSVKPYGAIGFTRYKEEITLSYGDYSYSEKYNDSAIHLGIGARAQFDAGVYADMRFDLTSIDSMDADYFSFTVGYKF